MKRYTIINHGEDSVTVKQAARLMGTDTVIIESLIFWGKLKVSEEIEGVERITIASLEKYLSSLKFRITFGSSRFADPIVSGLLVERAFELSSDAQLNCIWETIEH